MNLIEISVDSLESAVAAEQGGAHRVELCSALREGGLTPSLGLIRAVRARLSIPTFVLIRPRSGDFLYTKDEMRIMQEDIAIAAAERMDGVVLGVLTESGEVDIESTASLVEKARPMQVTFHRAFDLTCNLEQALEDVIRSGAQRILSSGGKQSATLGRNHLRALAQASQDRITLVAGGGVRPGNIAALAQFTQIHEFHSSMRHTQQSSMRFRNVDLSLGEVGVDEYERHSVLAKEVQQLVSAADAEAMP